MPKPNEPDGGKPSESLDKGLAAALDAIAGEYEGTEADDSDTVVEVPPAAAATPRQPSGGGARGGDSPEPPAHPPRLVELAKDYGFTDDDLNLFSTPALEVAVHREIRREREQLKREAQLSRADEANADRQRQRSQQAQQAAPTEDEIDWGEVEEEGVRRKIQETEVHEGVVNVMKKVFKELKDLKAEKAKEQEKQAMTAQERFEQAFDASCSKFDKLLGQGTATQLKNTKFFKRRLAVYRQVAEAIQNNPKIKLDEAVLEAVKELYDYEPEPEPPSRKGGAPKIPESAYTNNKLPRPTGKKPELKKGRERAQQTFDELYEEYAPEKEVDDDEDDEGY